ncbi:hypothetical protein SprV_0301316100 [Sparganum proliferum]
MGAHRSIGFTKRTSSVWGKYDEAEQQLKRAHIIEFLELCLKTFFTFNGQVYEQKKGTPMGSPLSGLIAEAVLQRLEQQVFSSYPPKFWARYVDDTFVVIKRSEVKAFKALLNSIFPDIQFTMEEEVSNQLPFLDIQITSLTDGKIRTTVYRKATNTRRILHFRSNHPVGHKRSCVRTLFQRVQTHCSDDSGRKEEINYLQALFKANGYPKSFIRNCLKKPHFERSSGEKPKFWLSIPYVKNVSEATARILKPFGIGVAHKPECTIRQQIMKPKDPLPTTEQSAVVYSIPCLNCDARYAGETCKCFGTRLHEHQLAINRKDKLSMVYGHMRELNHDFAFDKARTSNPAEFYTFSAENIDGEMVSMERYKGKVCLVVNVATKCGLTDKNYAQLQQLYTTYADQGLHILAFPCNQFAHQEPGTNAEIKENTTDKYHTTFELFSKCDVNGSNALPLFKYLQNALPGTLINSIKWNFTKFLIGRDGTPYKRYSPQTDPMAIHPPAASRSIPANLKPLDRLQLGHTCVHMEPQLPMPYPPATSSISHLETPLGKCTDWKPLELDPRAYKSSRHHCLKDSQA